MSGHLHAEGYEGDIEEAIPVEEFYRASCTLCDWKSDEFDGLSWKDAEEAAIEHHDDKHADPDDDDEDEDEEADG